MRQQARSVIAAALVAASVGFAVGTAWHSESAGAAAADANTPILKSINAKLTGIQKSLGRNSRAGIWNETEDSKDFLRRIEVNTRR